ncbi:hypothetical protein PUV54_03545 [Hyphococcus flavus]|uniref:Uncharacterized protein n=1 Tax=Hyphococcus flavus TaxID=1866326 RepID=A0AAE9ZKF8_9PROT|nr:hypothetical protein [Hyphococcus flavus]WDI32265.1 hypothetical protein PUV54_03545 [Hyphococcus flavus]
MVEKKATKNPPQGDEVLRHKWQRLLLPFLTGGIFLLGVVFFAVSAWQLDNLGKRFEQGPEDMLASSVFVLNTEGQAENSSAIESVELGRERLVSKPLFILEHDLVARRYHQANSLLIARVWFGYIMITTGMILCLIGSLFVLGKLSSGETTVSGSAGKGSVSFVSTSPGLVLAFFGAVLAISSQFFATRLSITDTATYIEAGAPSSEVEISTEGFGS